MNHIGCKHLDYTSSYADCEIVKIEGMGQYWKRNNLPFEGAPSKVQFCGQGRGRINGIFQCINYYFIFVSCYICSIRLYVVFLDI